MVYPDERQAEAFAPMTAACEAAQVDTASAGHQRSRLTSRVSIILLIATYVSLSLTFGLLTRAWEADDEPAHTRYIEYIVRHDSLPRISVANGLESHQPPLYYLLAAGWQRVLGIPAFTPKIIPAHYKNPYEEGRLPYAHDYTPTEHQDAIYLRELRLLSVLLGLGTVLLTYAAARVLYLPESVALCSGLFVALLPRELVVSSGVTNDALVVPLCSLALLLFLLAERNRAAQHFARRRLYILGMGAVLGAAATTKLNGLPIAVVLFALVLVPAIQARTRVPSLVSASKRSGNGSPLAFEPRLLADAVIGILGFLAVSGWWFIRNERLYGQFLATKESEHYLSVFLLHPVPWSTHLFVTELPNTLWLSPWYLQPGLALPTWVNSVLGALAIFSLLGSAWYALRQRSTFRSQWLSVFSLVGCTAAGLIAIVIIIKSVGTSDARLAYVGLSAFAIVVVVGATNIASRASPRLQPVGLLMWPVAFVAVDLFVLFRYLVPLGGL